MTGSGRRRDPGPARPARPASRRRRHLGRLDRVDDRSTTRRRRGPPLPAAAGPDRRRRRRAADLPPARRGPLAARRPRAQYTVSHPIRGDDVAALQQRLLDLGFDPGHVDGIFGPRDRARAARVPAQRRPPRRRHLRPGDVPGARPADRTVVGGKPVALREHEAIRRSGPTLAGKVVVIDPGHGGADTRRAAHGLTEAEVAADLAARVEGRLIGARRAGLPHPRPRSARRAAARRRGARGVRQRRRRRPRRLAARRPHPNAGARAASRPTTTAATATARTRRSASGSPTLLQHEIVTRTDLLDCRTHAKTWDLLRATRMPAVRLELGYLTQPGRRRAAGRPRVPRHRRRGRRRRRSPSSTPSTK